MRDGERRDGYEDGFTLLEVVVAMTISAMLLLGARAVLSEVGDATLGLAKSVKGADRKANADGVLRSLIANVDNSSDSMHSFRGDSHRVQFDTWCTVPAGWMEKCRASVGFEPDTGGETLFLRSSANQPVTICENARRGELQFLDAADGESRWIRMWISGATSPLAIEIICDTDTLIVPLGERG